MRCSAVIAGNCEQSEGVKHFTGLNMHQYQLYTGWVRGAKNKDIVFNFFFAQGFQYNGVYYRKHELIRAVLGKALNMSLFCSENSANRVRGAHHSSDIFMYIIHKH